MQPFKGLLLCLCNLFFFLHKIHCLTAEDFALLFVCVTLNGTAVKALPDTDILNFYLLISFSRVSTDSLFNGGSSIRGIRELKCTDQYFTQGAVSTIPTSRELP